MLPAELEKQHAAEAAYQRYKQWQEQSQGRWGWWSGEAAKAAKDAGIQQTILRPGDRSELTDWGENVHYDANGQEYSTTNSKWTDFVKNYMAQHGSGTAYNQGGGDPADNPYGDGTPGPGAGQSYPGASTSDTTAYGAPYAPGPNDAWSMDQAQAATAGVMGAGQPDPYLATKDLERWKRVTGNLFGKKKTPASPFARVTQKNNRPGQPGYRPF